MTYERSVSRASTKTLIESCNSIFFCFVNSSGNNLLDFGFMFREYTGLRFLNIEFSELTIVPLLL